MRRKHLVLWGGLALAIAIPASLLVHRARRSAGLDQYLTHRGFVRQARCELPGPVIERASEMICYRGALGRISSTLVFASRFRPGFVPRASQVALDSYVGVFLDAPDDPAWLAAWTRSPDVLRAARAGNLALLAWGGPWSAGMAARRLDAIEASVPEHWPSSQEKP